MWRSPPPRYTPPEEELMMTAAVALLVAADLFAAIRAQDLAQVEKLLAEDPSLAAKVDEKGVSPVSLAMGARKGEGFLPRKENRVLEALLRRNPPLSPFETAGIGTPGQVRALARDREYVRSVAKNGWTPLHYAAFNDNAETAAALLDAGADVNARAKNEFDNTPLQVSLLTSSREVARVLLARGADVNARQAEGITALHEAAQSGDLEIIRMLLAAGADPKAASAKFGTPHDLARKGKHAEAARLLVDAGKQP
jgi:ankyrin repeat protein